VSCPSGYYCPDAKVPPVPCESGHYSSSGNKTCAPCPEGKSCLDPAQAPVSCKNGEYSLSVSEFVCQKLEYWMIH